MNFNFPLCNYDCLVLFDSSKISSIKCKIHIIMIFFYDQLEVYKIITTPF